MTKRRVYVRVPAWDRQEVPDGMFRLAERRVEHLFHIARRETLEYLFASAYLQGVNDTLDVIEKRGLPEPAEHPELPPIDPRDLGLRESS